MRVPLVIHEALKMCVTENMNRLTLIVIMSLLVVGCSHTHRFNTYEVINSRAKGKVATLKLANGANIWGRDVQVTPDSTYWTENRRRLKHAVLTSQVHQIVIVSRPRGAFEGFLMLLVAGQAVGVKAFLSDDDKSISVARNISLMYIYPGIIIGIPLGVLIGSRDVYVLREAVASESPPPRPMPQDAP